MKEGTVFLHLDFQFKDSTEKADKWFVVLNNYNNDGNFLCCKTTSRHITDLGCIFHKNRFVTKDSPFKCETAIQFDRHSFNVFEVKHILGLRFKGQIILKGNLTETCLAYLLKCISNSDDIPLQYLKQLGIYRDK